MSWIYLLFILNTSAQAVTPDIVLQNNKGVRLMESEKSLQSQGVLQDLVVNNPSLGVSHYNLAQAFERNKEPDKALKSYETALELTQSTDLKFNTHFNIAKIYEQKKATEKALESYQKALELKPDSIEVKTNIELLVQSNSGGGGGEQQQQQQQQQSQGKNPKDEQKDKGDQGEEQQQQQQSQGNQNKDQNKQRQQPQKFKSKALSERDVKQILEELKRQEDKIRAKMLNRNKSQESNVGKDW